VFKVGRNLYNFIGIAQVLQRFAQFFLPSRHLVFSLNPFRSLLHNTTLLNRGLELRYEEAKCGDWFATLHFFWFLYIIYAKF
jgi:hypothetical protein